MISLVVVTSTLALGFGSLTNAAGAAPPRQQAAKAAKADPTQPKAPGLSPTLTADATIKGLVYDEDGDLVDNVSVEAFATTNPNGDPIASDLTYEDGDSASHGAFTLHVPAGEYLVRYSSPLFNDRVFETAYYGGGAGTPQAIAAGATLNLDPMTLVEDTGIPVSGTVTDGTSNTLANIEVALYREVGGYFSHIDSTVTDADGKYTFVGVNRNRTYTVRAYGEYTWDGDFLGLPNTYLGQAPSAGNADQFTVPNGAATFPNLDAIQLKDVPEVTGTVSLANPTAEPNIEVDLYVNGPNGWEYVQGSYNEGDAPYTFLLNIFPGYDYTLGFYDYSSGYQPTYLGGVDDIDAATTFQAMGDGSVRNVGNTVLGADTSLLTGSVEDADGDAMNNAYVTAYKYDAEDDQYYGNNSTSVRNDGSYQIRLRWGGTYKIRATSYDTATDTDTVRWLGNTDTIDGATEVVADAAHPTLTGAPITFPAPSTKIVGKVLNGTGGPLQGATVFYYTNYCGTSDCWQIENTTVTNANGRYVFRNVEQDSPNFVISAETSVFAPTFAGGGTGPENAPPIATPASGTTATVTDITLDHAPNTAVGTIAPEDDHVLDGDVSLALYQLVDDGVGGYNLEYVTEDYLHAHDDQNEDTFAFGNLAPGNYTVQSQYYANDDHGYVDSWLGGARPSTPTDPGVFEVDGTTNPIDAGILTLQRGAEITFAVAGGNGQPLSNTSIQITPWNAAGDGFEDSLYYADTDEDGIAKIRVPDNTDYFVSAYREGYASFNLGGEAFPVAQTPENTLAVANADVALPIEMTPEWGNVGAVAGQKLEYCLANTFGDVTFGGLDLDVDDRGLIQRTDDHIRNPFADSNRLPALAPSPSRYGSNTTHGVSADGNTLCVLTNDYEYTVQTLITEAPGGGFHVVYNYDHVEPTMANQKAGFTDGNGPSGTTTLFAGGDDGGYADGQPTALIANTLGGAAVNGRYEFDFSGFNRGGALENATGPAIQGQLEVGQTLTADPGTWTLPDGSPATGLEFLYSWESKVGPKVTGPTFVVQPNNAGRRIWLNVKAFAPGFDPGRAAKRQLIPGDPVATNDTLPVVTPVDPAVGDDLTVDIGTWTPAVGADNIVYSYKWLRNGHRIRGESDTTYRVRSGDQGDDIAAKVTARQAGFADVSATSASVSVQDLPQLTSTVAPTLTGTPKVGQTLTGTPGTWQSGGAPVTITYKWSVGIQERTADSGTGGTTYTMTNADKFDYVTLEVKASAPGFAPGIFTKSVGPVVAADAAVGDLTITVVNDGDNTPVPGYSVSACEYDTYTCIYGGVTDAQGKFVGNAVSGALYYVTAYSPDYSTVVEGTVTMPATGPGAITLRVVTPVPPPDNVSLPTANGTYGGVPTVYYGEDQTIEVTGCDATVNPTYTVVFTDGTPSITGPMTKVEGPTAGISKFRAIIPAFYPSHGDANINTNIPKDCLPNTPPTVISIYIDPSGVVTDQFGRPLVGASATLSRADQVAGPFTVVPQGSDIMSPDNRNNPSLTDNVGFFRWDVIEGWYRVKLEANNCTTFTTDPMQVNPPQVDLLIKLQCNVAAPTLSPTITGTPKVGQTLSTNVGDGPDGMDVTVQWLRDGAEIPGATDSTYEVQAADIGKTITVKQAAQRPDYVQSEGRGAPVSFNSINGTSAGVTGALGDAPTANTPPVIAGSGKVETLLTATDPVWSTTGVANTRAWFVAGAPVAGETAATYTVRPGDIGKAITVKYTGTKAGLANGTTTSNAINGVIGDAPTTTSPVVTGTGKVDSVLTVPDVVWSRAGTTSTRAWLKNGVPIAGQTGPTYTVVVGDLGATITAKYTGTKVGFTDGTTTSNGITGVAGDAPTPTAAAGITGSGKVGSDLTAVPPTWDLPNTTSTGRQWLLDGAVIAGQTGGTYTVLPTDLGKAITVKFVGTLAGHSDGASTSAPVTAALGDPALNTAVPTITGTKTVGQTLTAVDGTWDPASGLTFTHQWLRNGAAIAGATSPTYKLVTADAAQMISVKVTASRTGFTDGEASSVSSIIAKLTSTTSAKASPPKIKKGKKGKVIVTVKVPGVASPTGAVLVKEGAKVVGRGILGASSKGVVTVALGKLKPGKHNLTASYAGNATTSASTAKPVKVTMAKKKKKK